MKPRTIRPIVIGDQPGFRVEEQVIPVCSIQCCRHRTCGDRAPRMQETPGSREALPAPLFPSARLETARAEVWGEAAHGKAFPCRFDLGRAGGCRVSGDCVRANLYDFGYDVLRLWIIIVLILFMFLCLSGFVFPRFGVLVWVIFWSLDFFSGSRLTVGVGGDYIRPTTTAAPGFGRRL